MTFEELKDKDFLRCLSDEILVELKKVSRKERKKLLEKLTRY